MCVCVCFRSSQITILVGKERMTTKHPEPPYEVKKKEAAQLRRLVLRTACTAASRVGCMYTLYWSQQERKARTAVDEINK